MSTVWSKPTKYVIGIALAIVGVYLLYLSRSLIPIVILAALIAMIVRPPILWLQRQARVPRGLAVALVYLGLLILIPLGLVLVIPTLIDAVSYVLSLDYRAIVETILEWLRSTLISIRAQQLPLAALDDYIDRLADALLLALEQATVATEAEPPSVSSILQSLGSALTTTFDVAAGVVGEVVARTALLIFTFLMSLYISLSAHTYQSALLDVVPLAYRPEIAALLTRIGRLWNGFFRGELTLMLVIGVMTWLGLTLLGVHGALYLAIVAGLLEILPNLGPVIATVPAVIVALLQGSTHLAVSPLLLAGLVILFYILVQQLENHLIVPRVLGGAVELPALIVILGLTVGASVGGVLGALLATPIIASGREVLRYCYTKILEEEPTPAGEAAPEASPAETENTPPATRIPE